MMRNTHARRVWLAAPLLLVASVAAGAQIESIHKQLGITMRVTERPAWPKPPAASVQVTLVAQTAEPGPHVVSFGVPFGPGWLSDDKQIRVLGPDGKEIPAFARPLVYWWLDGKRGTIRSVLVQFEASVEKDKAQTVTLTWDQARAKSRPKQVPVSETQFTRHVDPPKSYAKRAYSFDHPCPKIVALLPPAWLCASLVAWQQVPAAENQIAPWFDKHLLDKVEYSFRNISAKAYEAYLFDRQAVYAKIYCRHGEARFLLAALAANDFYLQHLDAQGFFDLKRYKDFKYSFNEGSAILYMLTGDPRYLELVNRIVKLWEKHTYARRGKLSINYTAQSNFWTERHHAFGMAAYVHAYEITGEKKWLDTAKLYLDAALAMQVQPADGKAPDGAWVHRAGAHGDGNGWTTSPWMSAFLADSIWKYWSLTGDPRAASSLAMYAKFTEKHSVSPDGDMIMYMANSPGRGRSINPGIEHNFEGIYLLALGYYFSGGSDVGYLKKISTLAPPVMKDGANNPGRKFNWRFRETSKTLWLLYHALPTREASLKAVRKHVRRVLPEGPEAWKPVPGDADKVLAALGLELKVKTRPAWPRPPGSSVKVALVPQVKTAQRCVVSLGLPLGPGWLKDDRNIRVLDANRREVPAYTRELARWWIDGRRGTIRSVLVQFATDAAPGRTAHVTIALDKPRANSRASPAKPAETHFTLRVAPAPADAKKADAFDFPCPKVLAVLPADWLCASLVTWQQVPADGNQAAPWYDEHFQASFQTSLADISAGRKNYAAHLADRPATYAKAYVRHGRPEHLLAALKAGEHYVQHLGANGYHDIRPRPHRMYTFVEGSALLYLLTGEPRFREAAERAARVWAKYREGEYSKYDFWDEREHGLGMLAAVHMYELTGDATWRDRARRFFELALALQTHPADGRPPDGAWVHSAKSHGEGSGWLSSPWMSTFLADPIWKYWMLTGDQRAAASLLMYAKFVRDHAIGSKGVYDLANSPGRGDSTRPSVKHNLAGAGLLAFGYYLSGGDKSFLKKVDALWPAILKDDANEPAYNFARQFRASSTLVWLLAGAGGPR